MRETISYLNQRDKATTLERECSGPKIENGKKSCVALPIVQGEDQEAYTPKTFCRNCPRWNNN